MTHLDPFRLRTAFAAHPSGVVGVCATVEGQRTGMAVSTFVPVSLDPPLVAISIQNSSSTWRRLRQSRELGISLLSDGHAGTVQALASKAADRFAGVDTEAGPGGALFISGSALTLQVSVSEIVPAGDHQLVLLSVLDVAEDRVVAPILFHRSELRGLEAAVAAG